MPVYRRLLVPQTQHPDLQDLGQEQQGLLLGKIFLFQSIKREKPLSSTLLLVAHPSFSKFRAIFLLTFRLKKKSSCLESLHAAYGNVKWNRCYGKQERGSSKNRAQSYIILQFHFRLYIQKNWKVGTQAGVIHPCSFQHYAQQLKGGSNPNE